jgi:hypothetical protein
MLRTFTAGCALAALIEIVLWIGDKATGLEFKGGWILFSSILWPAVFWFAHWFRQRKNRS